MANFMEHLGLDFLVETEDQVRGLWGYIAQEGKAITGYYGYPYLNQHFGDAQLILRTIRNDEEKRIEVVGMDTHSSGNCVWEVYLSDMNITRKDADIMERRCVVKRKSDGGGMAVVNIVNADVLPSFDEGTELKLQMIAFPAFIEYFKDEDEYADAQPESRSGKKLLLSDGTMMPTGLIRNRDPESDEFESNENLDDLMLIRGTVKKLYHGVFALGDEKHNAYLRCIIGTEHGDLEIVHTIDEVKEEQRDNIRVGATVNGVFTLSGDAAIYEYDQGIVLDEPNDLLILRSTFAGADAERIRYVFAEDAVYLAEYNGTTYSGRDAIIDRLKFVAKEANDKYFAHLATITSVDDGDEALPYKAGTRCIVLASGEENNYESIAFVEINDDGRISKLVTSSNSRYHFRVDEKPRYKTPLDDIELPKSVVEPIIMRARYHGVISDDVTDDMILKDLDDTRMYENNIRNMLATMPTGDEKTNLRNLFGYLFAKAVETEFSEKQHVGLFKKRLVVSYTPGDAWAGEINTLLKPEQNEKIVAAMELGKQFAKDFAFFHPFDEPHDDEYDADLLKALIVVQQLGKLYEPKCMK
jgi:ketosteroid isomerase-like protein